VSWRAVALAALAASVPAVALAAPARLSLPEAGVSFAAPAGWHESAALALKVQRGFAAEAELAGAPGQKLRTGSRAWESPVDAADKGVLHLQWIVAPKATEAADMAALVRAELDDARQRPRLTTLPRGAFELVAWSDKVEGKLAWGQLEFRNVDNETRTLARTTVFVDADGRLHEIRVECTMTDGPGAKTAGDPMAPRTGCEAAMTAVAPLAPAELQAVGELPGQGTLRVTGPALPDGGEAEGEDGAASARPDGGLELKTPRPGDSAVTPRTPPPAPPPPPGAGGGFSRMLLLGGALLMAAALAVTLARRKPQS
jgi:hypothetical protein